jgi:phenylacetate-coenzyme A ligase PaaK-like adenylate-forming protein
VSTSPPIASRFPLAHDLYGRLQSFQEAPFLTAERLAQFTSGQRADERATEFESCPQCYFQTSGTAGEAKRLPYSDADIERLLASGARDLALAGVCADDVVLNLAAPLPSMAGWGVKHASERLGATVLNTSYLDCEPVLAGHMADRVSVVVGTPLTVQNVGEDIASEHGSARALFPRLATAILGGDVLPAHLSRRLFELWQFEIRVLYASVEAGTIAVQCSRRVGMHVLADPLVLELLPEGTLTGDQPDPRVAALREIGQCAPGERGELVISQLERQLLPLVRYRTGDIVEICGVGCPCGLGTTRIRVLGRRLNMIEIGGGVVHEMQLDRAISEALRGSSYHDWRATVTGNGTPEARMEVRLLSDERPAGPVTRALREALARDPGVAIGHDRLTVSALPSPEWRTAGGTARRGALVKAQRLTFS